MAPIPTARSFIGVAKETTKGTAVAPTSFVPVGGFNPKRVPTMLLDEGWRGSNVDAYGSQHGKVHSEIEIEESPLFVDTFGFPMISIFGEEALTGAGPYTHVFTVLNSGDMQPVAQTWTDMVGSIGAKAWPGVQLSEVTLSIDPDGNVTWSASGNGFPEAAASTPTAAFSMLLPMQGWRMSATLNGTAIQPISLEVTFSREIEIKKTANASQNPFAIWVGKLSVSVSGEIVAEGDTHHAALVADTQGILSITGTRGAGASAETLTVLCTKTAYEAVEIGRGQSEIHYDLSLKAIANTTDVGVSAGYGPAKVTLVGPRSTVY